MKPSHQALRAQRTVNKMIGRKFGRLTVISHHSRSKGYNCLCDCGVATIAKTYELKTGRHQSCGCMPRRLHPEHIAAKKEIYKNYKAAATRRGYEFSLTEPEFFNLILKTCHYCGATPSLASPLKRHKDFKYNGVDRVDNTVGYTRANCVPCCDICNNSKSTLRLTDWLAWVHQVFQFQCEKGTFREA